jgi:hypothetical protein
MLLQHLKYDINAASFDTEAAQWKAILYAGGWVGIICHGLCGNKTGSVNVILKMLQQHYLDCKELVLFAITARNSLCRACTLTFLSRKW